MMWIEPRVLLKEDVITITFHGRFNNFAEKTQLPILVSLLQRDTSLSPCCNPVLQHAFIYK